jgi:type VI secretion system protein ImpH
MATEIGTETAGLAEASFCDVLAEDACSFEFFQAVALLQRLRRTMRPVGDFASPEDEVVRFTANPRMAFPASEIQQLALPEAKPAEMMVNFMGLTGPMGVLPHVYSELILERLRAKDTGLASFFEIFDHRAISLFYRAWERNRFHVNYGAGARDLFTRYLLDLLGLGTNGLLQRQEIEDDAFLPYISLLSMQSRSAQALEQALAAYFEVPVEVQQFSGAWYSIDESSQCAIDERETMSSQMGIGAVVGDAVWDCQSRVRIRIGPLRIETYREFLPEGSAYRALHAITRFFANDCLDFELQLVLDRSDVPTIELDFDKGIPARLGWTSWAKTAPMGADPDETILGL